MPRYFLHVTNGQKTYTDTAGLELNDAAAAEAFALIIANDLRADAGYETFYVDVRDQQGNQLAKVFVVPRH